MRDPAGRIAFEGETVIRRLNRPAGPDHFLRSTLAARWVSQGDLVSYEWIDPSTVHSPRLPFITLPSEWTAPQFYAAARLTMRLQAEAVAEGWDLKDASAWNIVFDGLRPVFVDLLSFEPLQNKLWLAAGQFSRHFLLPLVLASKQRMEPRNCLQLWRDGVPPESARQMLGLSRFLTRYWPFMTEGRAISQKKSSARSEFNKAEDAFQPPNEAGLAEIQLFRNRLHTSLNWMLEGVAPTRLKVNNTVWGQYEQERNHYAEPALVFKRQIISRWLQTLSPAWVLDVGCNAGEFSELAVTAGARAICWDADSQALATLFLRHSASKNAERYHLILGPVDDAPGGRGWMATEFPPLMQRLNQRVDVVMLLAVTHHLAIAGSVRLEDIFRFVATVTRRTVLLELLSEEDERVQQLCQHYGRAPSEFTIQKQYQAAEDAGFQLVQRTRRSPDDTREYAWLEHQPIA